MFETAALESRSNFDNLYPWCTSFTRRGHRKKPDTFSSVYFVKEVDKFLEIYFIVRFYSCYFDHSIDFLVCYAFTQELEYVLQVILAYISFPKLIKNYLNRLVALTFIDQTWKRRALDSSLPWSGQSTTLEWHQWILQTKVTLFHLEIPSLSVCLKLYFVESLCEAPFLNWMLVSLLLSLNFFAQDQDYCLHCHHCYNDSAFADSFLCYCDNNYCSCY